MFESDEQLTITLIFDAFSKLYMLLANIPAMPGIIVIVTLSIAIDVQL